MNPVQKILIVDDNPRNLLVLEQALAETGAALLRAGTGDEALRLSLDHEFALAILDVQMPGMTGFELAEFLRGDSKTRHLPIIFLSAAFTELQDFFQGYKTGAVDYMLKPFQPPILLGKVKIFLELDQQRKDLDAQRRMLEAANHELEAFSYSVSHDLRAPLRSIMGYSTILSEDFGSSLPEEAQGYLERVLDNARRMDTLIQDLLQFSRMTRKEIVRSELDVSALAEEIAAELQKRQPERSGEFRISGGLAVKADQALLKVVLENLLGNAWKYSSHQPAALIEVGQGEFEGQPAFFVRDNGAGFDMAQVARIFDPFVRLHSASEFEGTGIGLATVQRIVHRHGGRIWAEGSIGQGATFYFVL
jgi:signal transduction histidine kinase